MKMEEEAVANEAAILERRQEIRASLRAVENSLKEAGAVTDGYDSAYLLEFRTARGEALPSSSLFRRQCEHVSEANLTRSAAFRFDFDPADEVRYRWKLLPLGEAKCRQVWRLFDADEDEMWTHREFLEYMAALKCANDSAELKAFEDSAEIWRMYMSDMCELDEEGKLTFEGFVMYRELIEDEHSLARDLMALGISLEWEEVEKTERIKQLFDDYVDDPTGGVTAKAAQYLLAEIGFVLTREETTEIIERRYQLARALRFVHQLKRTLRLFGYRQKSALKFCNEGLAKSGHSEEEPRICKVGLLSLVFSSWHPAVKTVCCNVLEHDGQVLVDKFTWFIGEFFRDHIEALPFYHRWFVSLPTKVQRRMGPSSSGAAGTSAMVVRLVILFTGKMDLYHVMQTLGLPSSMQFDHLIQRFSVRWLCSHSLEDILVTKNLNLGSQWSCRTQMELRLNRQACSQILHQVARQLDTELEHERDVADYIARVKAEREQTKKKSVVQNQRQSSPTRPDLPNNHQNFEFEHFHPDNKTESGRLLLIKSLRHVANYLQHSQQMSSTWTFASLGAALRENQWFSTILSPRWHELLTRVLETPGGLAAEWKSTGDSFRAEFAETNYATAGMNRPVLEHHPVSRTMGSSKEFTLAPLSTAATKAPPTARLSESPKLTSRRSNIQHELNQPAYAAPEAVKDKSTEDLLLEFYDLCARHMQGVHVVRAEAGTSGVTCVLEGWNFFSLLPRIHQGQLAKKASLIRLGTFSSRQPLSSRSMTGL
ncbi:unnamed protein product [Phytophthora lilii]|uniref:Unnamed protein product n=1 Tax=Phytophthora lilii TaxID=2077276 RepID=A0A9W6TWR9_9STRA|nr:unnamed protein product [Phytophthora lilii]